MVSNGKTYSIDELSTLIESSINGLDLPLEPKNLYDPIRHIISSGGKRIRPVLVLAGTNLFSDEIEQSYNAALAIEIFHNFTLVHDDIMDNALKRRGIDTVHTKWNNNIAILSGDAMNIFAYKLLSNTNPKHLSLVLEMFNGFSLGICEGQQLDMDFEAMPDISIDAYLKMIELKTAILIKGALQIGALLGEANNDQIEKIGKFGLNLGMAFQLQDDLLDLYGDPKIFGKKVGGDIIAKKKTILYLNALKESNNRMEIVKQYNNDSITEENKIKTLGKIFNELNIKTITENQISFYYSQAIDYLNRIDVDQNRKTTLYKIANNIMKRDK